MGKIEQNREKKRQDILKAAKGIFLSEGYVLANMDKIALQAQMTKQTVYRYFPSKIELFQATLKEMGKQVDDSFVDSLKNEDTEQALVNFAIAFMQFHLSEEHIATYRLLVAESAKAPEILDSFHTVGPDPTKTAVCEFFENRLNVSNSDNIADNWLSMLLTHREGVVMGMDKPTKQQVEAHAKQVTTFLLSAIL